VKNHNSKSLHETSILIIGSNGQLGKAFQKELSKENVKYFAPDENKCNITNFNEISETLDSLGPDIVINCAAYNAVDDAESNEEIADLVNHRSVKHLADICNKNNSLLIHYGTDYVFDGNKGDLYVESDSPNPLNIYGKSKFAGEQAVLCSGCKSLVLRPSWVYGDGKQNFVYKLLGWAEKNKILKISSDEASIPTSTDEIVKVTLMLIKKDITGLFHLTNSNYCSRYEWCRFVLETLKKDTIVIPVPMSHFKTQAKRPAFTAMSNNEIVEMTGYDIPHWKTSLKEYLLNLEMTMMKTDE
jgi:dTDP-4-dehydrorhamnose reductase